MVPFLKIRRQASSYKVYDHTTSGHADLCVLCVYIWIYIIYTGTAVAQWLRFYATNPKVAGSIPAGVIGIFH